MSESEIFGLTGILQKIFAEEQTGTLKVQGNQGEVYIFFRNGFICLNASSHKRSILAEALRRCDKIEKKTLETIFATQRKKRTTLLEVLKDFPDLDEEVKSDEFLTSMCRAQLEEDIYEVLTWEKPHCEFTPGDINEDIFPVELLAIPIELNPEAIAMESARRKDEWRLIYEDIPSTKDIPRIMTRRGTSKIQVTIKLDKSSMDESTREVLSLVNSIRDFEEIVAKAKLFPFQTMSILSKLLKDGKIRMRTPKELMEMTQLDIVREDNLKCIKVYERLEDLGVKNLETLSWLARAYEKQGVTHKAVEKNRELGASALEQNKHTEAVKAYRKVVDLASDDIEAYEKLIYSFYKSGELEKAAEISATYARKVSVVDKKKAIMVLDQANKIFPSSPSNLELMANLYLEMNDKENAMNTYKILAQLMRKQGKMDLTLKAYQKIISIDPNNLEAYIELADGYAETDQQQEAVEQYKKLGQLLYNKLQEEEEDTENMNILLGVCHCIIQYEPDSVVAREWLADAYIYKEDAPNALKTLRELLNLISEEKQKVLHLKKLTILSPEDYKMRKMLADTYLNLKKKSDAINEYLQLGIDTYEAGDMRRAREAFEAILRIDPFNLTGRKKHADILRQLNREARAVDEYKLVGYLAKSAKIYKDALEAFSNIVELAPQQEVWAFSEVASLCEILEEYPDSLAIEYYYIYAEKCYSQGNFGESSEICGKILALSPGDAKALELKRKADDKLAQMPHM